MTMQNRLPKRYTLPRFADITSKAYWYASAFCGTVSHDVIRIDI